MPKKLLSYHHELEQYLDLLLPEFDPILLLRDLLYLLMFGHLSLCLSHNPLINQKYSLLDLTFGDAGPSQLQLTRIEDLLQ